MTPGRLSRRRNFTCTKCHASASHTGLSSPRLLYWSENFTPVGIYARVSCKRETNTRFGVKSVCRQTGTGNACVVFVNSGWHCHVAHGTGKNMQTCKRDTKSRSHSGMKLAQVRVFSRKHPLTETIQWGNSIESAK